MLAMFAECFCRGRQSWRLVDRSVEATFKRRSSVAGLRAAGEIAASSHDGAGSAVAPLRLELADRGPPLSRRVDFASSESAPSRLHKRPLPATQVPKWPSFEASPSALWCSQNRYLTTLPAYRARGIWNQLALPKMLPSNKLCPQVKSTTFIERFPAGWSWRIASTPSPVATCNSSPPTDTIVPGR